MEGQYNRRIILEYLVNLMSSIGRNTAIAISIIDWMDDNIDFIQIPINIDDFSFSDKSRRYRGRGHNLRMSKKPWDKLVSDTFRASDKLRSSRPTTFDKNLRALGSYFKLDMLEIRLFDFYCRYRSDGYSDNLWEKIKETNSYTDTELIGKMLGVTNLSIKKRLTPNSRLLTSGFLTKGQSIRRSGYVLTIPDRIKNALSFPNRNFDDVRKYLIGTPAEANLLWSDFDHFSRERDLLASTLKGALKKKTKGINFLIYGPPGTGKTGKSVV